MKKLLALFVLSALLISCKTNTEKKTGNSSKIYEVEEFLASAGELKDQDVSVTGMVVHVCKHGGQKMFIVGEDKEERLLIRTSAGISEFDVELEGSTVEVSGKVIATVTQEATEGKGEGEEHAEETKTEEKACDPEGEPCESEAETEAEDCDFEKTDSVEVVVYHIQASSFKEISE